MSKKSVSRSLLAVLAILLLILSVSFSINNDRKRLEICFFNVGQGDASMIRIPGGRIVLIDGGPDNSVLKRVGQYLPFYKRKIDLIVLSHFHSDHIAGLIEILRRYRVGAIVYPEGGIADDYADSFLAAADSSGAEIIPLAADLGISYFSGCSLLIVNPSARKAKADDNDSLATKLDCRGMSAVWTGDNNAAAEAALLTSGYDWRAKILKAGHHGSKTANSQELLEAVAPNLMVISVGADNRFGHPNMEVLERAENAGIEVRRTDQEGGLRIR